MIKCCKRNYQCCQADQQNLPPYHICMCSTHIISFFIQFYKTCFFLQPANAKPKYGAATIPVTAITEVLYKNICCTFQSLAPNAFKIPVILVLSNTKMIRQVMRFTTATIIIMINSIFFICPCRPSQSKILG